MMASVDMDHQAVVQAIEDNMAAYWLSLGRNLRGAVYDGPELKWAYTGRPVLNRVVASHLAEGDADARIMQVLRRFDDWGASVAWFSGPSTSPPDLAWRLRARGFAHAGYVIGMALDLMGDADVDTSEGGPARLSVREVEDEVTHRAWLEVIEAAFRLPRAAREVFGDIGDRAGTEGQLPWRRYVGFLDHRPVSTATLVPNATAAGVYLVGTVPGVRRQGFGTALTRHVLAAARRHNYRLAVLQASQGSQPLYRELGFEDYCRFDMYRWAYRRVSPRRWLSLLDGIWSQAQHTMQPGRQPGW
jgi:ribosomal protein S18 acetylase RimI-like enzyme